MDPRRPGQCDPGHFGCMNRPSPRPHCASGREPGIATAWCLFAYVVIVVARPQDLIPGVSTFEFAKIAFGCALIAALTERSALTTRLRTVPLARTALYFFGLAALSVLFSIWPVHSLKMVWDGIVTLVASFVLIVKLGGNWAALRIIIRALPVSTAILSLHCLFAYTGIRPSGTVYYDPNDLAFALVSLFPLLCALAILQRGVRKLLLWGLALMTLVATLLTESRGGLIGLALVVLMMSLYSIDSQRAAMPRARRIGRALRNLLVAGVAAVTVWTFLPQPARTRLATVLSLQEDYNLTETSGRVSIWKRNFAAAIARPVGFGLGSFAAVDVRTGGKFKAAHNSFLEVFVELGLLGLYLYLRLFYVSWRDLRKLYQGAAGARASPPGPEWATLCRALSVSLIGMMACSFFLSEAFTNILWAVFSIVAAVTAANAVPAKAAVADHTSAALAMRPRGSLRASVPQVEHTPR
jgi:O-antigen ligase